MKKNKIIIVVLFMIFITTFQITASASEKSLEFSNVDYTKEAYIRVLLDNKSVVFDVNPKVIDGRTLVPMRAIFEALGLNVSWDTATKTAKGENSDFDISFVLGSKTASVNGQPKALDVAANSINNRTMIPLRFLSENMGYNVVWNGDSNLILLSKYDIVEWRTDSIQAVAPYRILQAKYINGSKTTETREIKSQFELDLNDELESNNNIPLLISSANVQMINSKPTLIIKFKNLSTKPIVAFKLSTYCFDDYGQPAKRIGYNFNLFMPYSTSLSDEKHLSGETWVGIWDVSMYTGVTKVQNIALYSAVFDDGTIWGTANTQTSSNRTSTSDDSTSNTSNNPPTSSTPEQKSVRVYTSDRGWIWVTQ